MNLLPGLPTTGYVLVDGHGEMALAHVCETLDQARQLRAAQQIHHPHKMPGKIEAVSIVVTLRAE